MAGSLAHAAAPAICSQDEPTGTRRLPAAVYAYLNSLPGDARFDQRTACMSWANTNSGRQRRGQDADASPPTPARFILFPAPGVELRRLNAWLSRNAQVHSVQTASRFVVASFGRHTTARRLRQVLANAQIEFAEPDCDGPEFLTTSIELMRTDRSSCWERSARATFPNDPCIEELWGHQKIGWDSNVAASSLPRVVAVLDSGIDSTHEDLAANVLLNPSAVKPPHSLVGRLNARCANGRCYPHGTEMAGTIGGRMDNGIGVAGVAPNSRLLPIVISRVDHGLLARLSTIAEGIDAAVRGGADVINISAKWPVDSRAISEAIYAAVGGEAGHRRLVVTGYATSLQRDETVREYFPSRYRCLPGVVAAVPADMRGRDLFNPADRPNANDGRIQAPGVDIVVTTTENSERGYALSEAAGASSAAAYVSGAVALVWGSPPLDECDAQQIKQLLFCRSKLSNSSRYPWINVDFLRELRNVASGSSCNAALEALGCG